MFISDFWVIEIRTNTFILDNTIESDFMSWKVEQINICKNENVLV